VSKIKENKNTCNENESYFKCGFEIAFYDFLGLGIPLGTQSGPKVEEKWNRKRHGFLNEVGRWYY